MADFCLQCTKENWGIEGHDYGELPPLAQDSAGYIVICEGCGFTLIDASGKCIATRTEGCLRGHGETKQVVYLAVAECMDGRKRNFICTDAGVQEDARTLDEMARSAIDKGFEGIFTNNWPNGIPGWKVEQICKQVFNVVSTPPAQLNRNTFVNIEMRLTKYTGLTN